jgi:hypothetical protein
MAATVAPFMPSSEQVASCQEMTESDLDFYAIPRSRQDPKIGGKDDAEIISDRIAKLAPFPRDFVA